MSQHFLVTGSGPVGSTVALQLADAGHTVVMATRSGGGPAHRLIRRVRVDATDASQLAEAAAGASAIFHCVHAAYRADAWHKVLPQADQVALEVAGAQGIPVIFPEGLYSYSEPGVVMTEDSPRQATGGKRGIRTGLLAAREASTTATVSVVASDFFGPLVENAHAGARMLEAVFSGQRLFAFGHPGQLHSFTFVPDLAAAMIRASERPELWNRILHAPTATATTQRALAAAYARAGGVEPPPVSGLPGWLVRLLGVAASGLGEMAEMAYQFDRPFIMDSRASQEALGLEPTALPAAAAATVDWWRNSRLAPA
ncbi:MAG: NAD-dependent epimerase/dehydratase family protein [Micrococcaceae bacterium]|uniref:NAD-dependent epimerase/dehydratase family protein n=1 Tax=Arthrobacter TaxID=1663 RepID=UPI00264C2489|nr:NAD-dependent epimerase/dehydratase family protein [Micrococcaceae bacterium]MDN5812615.1 NAD-dependent epimerase/dehydratase family protein [Micrococcaceae bacterium]MDN5878713.1 NAD-dependent epimerase/dehydratase family protein [Micrococcaceae bacterium]MDN5886237.1 NAD-dependent epimerase/dehydratase family protein [Micrococcaceae bacterium]MDN5904035.1 NAD-dependent epimerase/dehydratase family protein [Micrococcaceae bacterium]